MKNLLTKPEFWIGLITVIVVVTVTGALVIGRFRNSPKTAKIAPKKQQMLVENIENKPTVTIAPVQATGSAKMTVMKLANTAGLYEVREGDNFWKISVAVCGNGKYFESIQARNGSQALHKGDLLTIVCEE